MDPIEEYEKPIVLYTRELKNPFQALNRLAQRGNFKIWSLILENTLSVYDPSKGSAQINRGGEFLSYVKTTDDVREELIRRAVSISTHHRKYGFIRRLLEEYTLVPEHLEQVLRFAVTNNNLETAELALEKGAVATNEKLLEHAARHGNKKMIRLLIAYGANDWEYGQRGAGDKHLEIRRFFSRKLAGMEVEL